MELCADQPKIRVAIRKRPLNSKELARNEQDVVEVFESQQVKVREHKLKVDLTKYIEEHSFTFDSAFGEEVSNTQLYQSCVRPIVECAFLGARVTCFAYGQTGSGKTYTMNGDLEGNCPGIYYLGAEDIFAIRDSSYGELSIAVSFYEIYCGKLFDLLNNREQLQAREDGKQNVNIVGLTVKPLNSPAEFMETITAGSAVRITSQNSTNADSSRSHAILQISLLQKKKVYGKISFIDLAGCERGADTIDQSKQTKIDGAEINKSLLALKECIRALDQGKNHTPFRGSKLTMVLKDSFTGFCKTVMIGNVSPGSASCENTLNTLRYADRVKELKKGGAGSQGEGKDDQLARQLMLPRTQKNKQIIIKNEDDSDEEIVIKPSEQKSSQPRPNPSQQMGVPSKKTKYIQQPDGEQKRQKNTQPVRKGIMVNQKQSSSNARSVAHSNITQNKESVGTPMLPQGRGAQRNKSLMNKVSLKGVIGRAGEDAVVTERRSFNNNYSLANLNEKYREIMEESQRFNRKKNPKLGTHKQNKENSLIQPQYLGKVKTDASGEDQWIGGHRNNGGQWESLLDRFRNCESPSQSNYEEMSSNFEQLVKMIMKEELELSDHHKRSLLEEESSMNESLSLYNESQKHNKNNSEMMEFMERLHGNLGKRIKGLVEFQNRIEQYQYHLREHEKCERKMLGEGELIDEVGAGSEGLWDDE